MTSMKICILLVCFLLSQTFGATVFRKQRALADADSSQNSKDICQHLTPCGWAVYHRFTRDIDYFMKNKCECPDGKRCIRTDDDISVTAYVYRCKDSKKENQS